MTKRSLDCIYRALENYNLLELYLTTRLDDYDDFYCKFACIRGALIQQYIEPWLEKPFRNPEFREKIIKQLESLE